ncbi:cytochrome B5 [Candidatus Bathyarchaeota archaeon]|nr:cytochrome B5 [Candidatus Bathyarchaeota archaeon]
MWKCQWLEETKKFTLNELSKFNGKNGNLAYVGYKGKVYDVTESSQWSDGDHLGHEAGKDLTEQMEIAPHADEVMERFKTVGTLTP